MPECAALAVIGAGAFFVRVQGLGDESAWGDEIFTLRYLDAPSLVEFLRQTHGESPVPPLYMILEYAWARLFGTSVLAIRWLSVALGMLGLAGLYVLTRMLAGWRAALIASVWTAFAFWHVYHSQEIRFYGLTTTMAVLAMIAFVRYVATGSVAWLAANTALSLAMVWSHPHAGLLFAVQGGFLVFARRHDRRLLGRWIASHLAVSVTILLFYLAIDAERAMAINGWVPSPSLWGSNPSLAQVFIEFAGVRRMDPTNPVGSALTEWHGTIGALFVFAQFGLAIAGWRYLRRGGTIQRTQSTALSTVDTATLLLLWLLLPPLFLFLLSHLWRPMLLTRYVLYAAFPLYILIASFLGTRRAIVSWAAASIPILYFAVFCVPGPIRTPFEPAAEFIAARDDSHVVVYVDDMFTSIPLEFYLSDRDLEFITIVESDWMEEVVAGRVRPEDEYPWIALITPGRMRYWEKRLQAAAIDHEIRRFASGRTLMLIALRESDTG